VYADDQAAMVEQPQQTKAQQIPAVIPEKIE
jgi:hypothetical protein